jgi:hypothetical protein
MRKGAALVREVTVVRFRVRLGHVHHLQTSQIETLLLKPLNDLADESALDTVRLDHDVCSLHRHIDALGAVAREQTKE